MLIVMKPGATPADIDRVVGVIEALGIAGRAELSVWLRFDPVTRTITERDAIDYSGTRYEIVAPPVEIGRGEGIELFLGSADLAGEVVQS